MSNRDYPTSHCPLTGKICNKKKIHKITELYEGNSMSFSTCQECSPTWLEKYLDKDYTKIEKPETTFETEPFPAAIKELTDILFSSPLVKKNLPKIKIAHELPIIQNLFQDSAKKIIKSKYPDVTCHGCGLTLEEISKRDRLGCSECYEVFNKYLLPLIENYHGNLEYKGKTPKNWEENQLKEIFPAEEVLKFKIASLKDEQRDAISKEEYEKAGDLAKEIANLEQQLNQTNVESDRSHNVSPPPETNEDQ